MRSLKRFLVLLLALAWVPMTAHCKLEILPGLEFLHCVSETAENASSEGHCGDTNCCAVEHSAYKTDQQRVAPPSPDLLPFSLFSLLTLATPLPEEIHLGMPPAPPRDFVHPSWQFVLRAASTPRAPSIAS